MDRFDELVRDLLALAGPVLSRERRALFEADLNEGDIMLAIDDLLMTLGEARVSITARMRDRVVDVAIRSGAATEPEQRRISRHLAEIPTSVAA